MRKTSSPFWLVSFCLLVVACGKGDVPQLPAQIWEDVTVVIETRPSRIEKGMIEFLVIATRLPGKPAHNLLVSLSIDDTGAWQQAIQDGHMGVYRRAIPVTDPEKNVLNVRIQYDNREGMLYFPLHTPTNTGPSREGSAADSQP